MKINYNNLSFDISDKNVRVHEAMHHGQITTKEIKIYLLSSYPNKTINEITTSHTLTELEKAINTAIQTEAQDCFGVDFYRSI